MSSHTAITQRVTTSLLDAIRSPLFDLGVYDPTAFDGDGCMMLRTWPAAELLSNLDWLRHRNAKGNAIYIRPANEHPYSLIDDLSADAVKQMQSTGFSPCAIVETSANNFQCWVCHGETLPTKVSSAAAKLLAERFSGDLGAAAWRQFGRLPGFTNSKPKHRLANGMQPFVRLHVAKRVVYPEAPSVIQIARETVTASETKPQRPPSAYTSVTTTKQLSDFHADSRYGGDLHRADLAWATYALTHGLSPTLVADRLAERDLSHKGSVARQHQYVERTIAKALDQVTII